MKKTLVIIFTITVCIFFYECNNTPASLDTSSRVDSTQVVEEPCFGNDLFPIQRPSNAEPDSGDECQFYRWAWGTFLYVTDIDNGNTTPRFLSFETPSTLFGNDATPLFQDTLHKNMLLLAPRITEDSVVTSFSDVMQAISKGILIDKNGRVIYYAQHINDTFATFVRSNGFTDMAKLLSADPNLTFPRGSLELKSSWKVVMPGDDTSKFFTTKAIVAQFVTTISHGKSAVVIDPSKTKEETVALLGLHIVGVAQNHPEFIWATFEHDSLAPNNPNRNGQILKMPVDNDKNNPYLFYNSGDSAQNCDIKNPIENLMFRNQNKQTFKNFSSVFHQYWFDDDDKIDPLNRTVKKILHDKLSKWANYSFKGAVWLNDPKNKLQVGHRFSSQELADSAIFGGERELSNVTMETFTQKDSRCFTCHAPLDEFLGASKFPAKKIGLSHVITNAYLNSQAALLRNSNKKK